MIFIVAAILLAVVFVIANYNGLVRGRMLVREAWSGIDVQLKRRHDLIPNLVETVKGYSSHEKSLFEDIANTRSRTLTAGTVQSASSTETDLSRQLKSLFAVAEAYPDLKADKNFLDLQHSLVEVEDQLQYARRYYNGAVRDYNIRVESFPSNIIAGLFGFKREEFFEIEFATERDRPEIKMA